MWCGLHDTERGGVHWRSGSGSRPLYDRGRHIRRGHRAHPLAGWFQVFDGLQAVTSGVLRGTGDTRVPAVLHMVAFWGVGIPLGAWLGFRTPLRERGLWIGLVAGLAAAGLLQGGRVIRRLSGPIRRVIVDH